MFLIAQVLRKENQDHTIYEQALAIVQNAGRSLQTKVVRSNPASNQYGESVMTAWKDKCSDTRPRRRRRMQAILVAILVFFCAYPIVAGAIFFVFDYLDPNRLMPLWSSFGISAFIGAVCSAIAIYLGSYVRESKYEMRRRLGLCTKCEYDLTNCNSDSCPECGNELRGRGGGS